MEDVDEVVLEDGKYRFYVSPEGILQCDRNGELWRDFVGDKAVLALFRYALACGFLDNDDGGQEEIDVALGDPEWWK